MLLACFPVYRRHYNQQSSSIKTNGMSRLAYIQPEGNFTICMSQELQDVSECALKASAGKRFILALSCQKWLPIIRGSSKHKEQVGRDGTRTSGSYSPSSILLLHLWATLQSTRKIMILLKFSIKIRTSVSQCRKKMICSGLRIKVKCFGPWNESKHKSCLTSYFSPLNYP